MAPRFSPSGSSISWYFWGGEIPNQPLILSTALWSVFSAHFLGGTPVFIGPLNTIVPKVTRSRTPRENFSSQNVSISVSFIWFRMPSQADLAIERTSFCWGLISGEAIAASWVIPFLTISGCGVGLIDHGNPWGGIMIAMTREYAAMVFI